MDRFLRIDKRRPMLPFARQSFAGWFRSREKSADEKQSLGLVVLFNDTFMNFNYPSVGMARDEAPGGGRLPGGESWSESAAGVR